MFFVVRDHPWWSLSLFIAITACASVVWTAYHEIRTSERQARILSEEAKGHYFWIEPGDQSRPLAAPEGPVDQRRGYPRIPEWIDRLEQQHFEVTWRAAASPPALAGEDNGIYPLYDPAPQAGLTILGDDGTIVHEHRTPTDVFESFDELPDLLVDTLLFIENRELLEPGYNHRNPAVEWKRFAHASAALIGNEIGLSSEHFGGSTLATQLEKFRHSPGGITADENEKFRQMLTATLRAYRSGPETTDHQQQIVVDYVNGVPLAASPGYGEVEGLSDGLRVWFGADPDRVTTDLARLHQSSFDVAAQSGLDNQWVDAARSYRQVLSLFLAHRRPTHYLVQHPDDLHALTDAYARIMADHGIIGDNLRDAVLAADTPVLARTPADARSNFAERKAVDAVRASLLQTLDVSDVYRLDRHDLYVQSTIDAPSQSRVDEILAQFTDADFLDEHGLFGHRLLSPDDPIDEMTVSFTLFEQTEAGNALRILADNHDQPLNINEHVKLDLGSTAKLRTLVTYLEVVARLHGELHAHPLERLETIKNTAPDNLRRWVAAQIFDDPEMTLEAVVDAAMDRMYSANPNQNFFTGGGRHRFSNFEHRRNHTQSVREAFRHSVNLVFIRMMRDVRDYYIWLDPDRTELLLGDEDNEERDNMLARFADYEGRDFQNGFYDDYRLVDRASIPDAVVDSRSISPKSHAMVAAIFDDASPTRMDNFVHEHTGYEADSDTLDRWWERYSVDNLNWQDRGHLTGIHPLELWTAAWLYAHPDTDRTETMVASRQVRQDVYQWLFRTNSRSGQNRRIRTMLEIEAFDQIHHSWQRLGYPFDELVPSLATSIGSSADRPLALAELVGIIANDGLYEPDYRIDGIIAAPNTPYETRMERAASDPQRVLPAPVARAAREALVDVVESGTARRIDTDILTAGGQPLIVGGKTGTGDHDHQVFSGLRLVESRPVHRTATFVFFLGDRFFGTVTAFVSGDPAGDFRFTSALPTTLLNVLYPAIQQLVDDNAQLDGSFADQPGVTEPGQQLALAATGAFPRDFGFADAVGDRSISRDTGKYRRAPLDWESVFDGDPPRITGEPAFRPDDTEPRLPFDWNTLFPAEPPPPTSADYQGSQAALTSPQHPR